MPLLHKFQKIINIVKKLGNYDCYVGAFIFGSAARGELTKDSDLDVKIIVKGKSCCEQINHPFIEGIKLDITFISFDRLIDLTKKQITKADRIPFIGESVILFDKTGKLRKLRQTIAKIKRLGFAKSDYQLQQFLIYHYDDKVKRNLEKDHYSSVLAMNEGVNSLLKIYYQLNRKWWVSSKRILGDLDSWDKNLSRLLRKFIIAKNIKQKFQIWCDIVFYVSKPFGGVVRIENNICQCSICMKNLANLAKLI